MASTPTNDDAGQPAPLRSDAGKRREERNNAVNNLQNFVDLIDIPGVPAAGVDPLKPRLGAHHIHWLSACSVSRTAR